jgi:hypothetical protein
MVDLSESARTILRHFKVRGIPRCQTLDGAARKAASGQHATLALRQFAGYSISGNRQAFLETASSSTCVTRPNCRCLAPAFPN